MTVTRWFWSTEQDRPECEPPHRYTPAAAKDFAMSEARRMAFVRQWYSVRNYCDFCEAKLFADMEHQRWCPLHPEWAGEGLS